MRLCGNICSASTSISLVLERLGHLAGSSFTNVSPNLGVSIHLLFSSAAHDCSRHKQQSMYGGMFRARVNYIFLMQLQRKIEWETWLDEEQTSQDNHP